MSVIIYKRKGVPFKKTMLDTIENITRKTKASAMSITIRKPKISGIGNHDLTVVKFKGDETILMNQLRYKIEEKDKQTMTLSNSEVIIYLRKTVIVNHIGPLFFTCPIGIPNSFRTRSFDMNIGTEKVFNSVLFSTEEHNYMSGRVPAQSHAGNVDIHAPGLYKLCEDIGDVTEKNTRFSLIRTAMNKGKATLVYISPEDSAIFFGSSEEVNDLKIAGYDQKVTHSESRQTQLGFDINRNNRNTRNFYREMPVLDINKNNRPSSFSAKLVRYNFKETPPEQKEKEKDTTVVDNGKSKLKSNINSSTNNIKVYCPPIFNFNKNDFYISVLEDIGTKIKKNEKYVIKEIGETYYLLNKVELIETSKDKKVYREIGSSIEVLKRDLGNKWKAHIKSNVYQKYHGFFRLESIIPMSKNKVKKYSKIINYKLKPLVEGKADSVPLSFRLKDISKYSQNKYTTTSFDIRIDSLLLFVYKYADELSVKSDHLLFIKEFFNEFKVEEDKIYNIDNKSTKAKRTRKVSTKA